MEAKSNHYRDVANWIEKVINSCETPQQEIVARNLARLFEQRLWSEKNELYVYYTRHLRDVLDNKFYTRLESKLKDNANAI